MLTTEQYRKRAQVMLTSFVIVLILMFLPIYPGLQKGTRVDGLTFMDNFFNSLSKFSSNFMEQERGKAARAVGTPLEATLAFKDLKDAKDKNRVIIPAADLAQDAVKVLAANGVEVSADGANVAVKGDLGKLLEAAIADAELMYNNDGQAISAKYQGMNERAAVFAWHNTIRTLGADYKKAGRLAESNLAGSVTAKALEPAYNYYQVEAKSRIKYLIPLLLALGFYVLYTCWYGFGIMYMFEALGVKLDH